MRRGDLCAGRLGVEQARLALEQAATEAQKQKEFWAWTEKPEIQAKLYPDRDPEQMRQEVIRMLDRGLLGVRHEPVIDPAVLI